MTPRTWYTSAAMESEWGLGRREFIAGAAALVAVGAAAATGRSSAASAKETTMATAVIDGTHP